MTITTFVEAPSQRVLRAGLLLLLTLAAGWTDALAYLVVGRVFASFMTGNILFVGLSIAQGDTALLVRAGVSILLFLLSVTLGTRYLQALPTRRSVGSWRRTIARYLLGEALVLLAAPLVWSLTGDLAQHPGAQVAVLGIGAFAMGLQAALVAAFNIPNVVSVALTGTELLLGIRLAQWIGKPTRQSADQPGGTSVSFLLALMVSYTLAALVVGLTIPRFGLVPAFIPCLLVALTVVVILVMPSREGRERT